MKKSHYGLFEHGLYMRAASTGTRNPDQTRRLCTENVILINSCQMIGMFLRGSRPLDRRPAILTKGSSESQHSLTQTWNGACRKRKRQKQTLDWNSRSTSLCNSQIQVKYIQAYRLSLNTQQRRRLWIIYEDSVPIDSGLYGGNGRSVQLPLSATQRVFIIFLNKPLLSANTRSINVVFHTPGRESARNSTTFISLHYAHTYVTIFHKTKS